MENHKIIIEVYEKMKTSLQDENIEVNDYKLINYGLQFNILSSNSSGLIRVYQNKKGLIKIDYSQIKDKDIALKIQTLIKSTQPINIKTSDNDYFETELPIIGTDESGKGDYFGPLVSAGVYIDNQSAKKLIEYGVKDSKKLSDRNNLELAKKTSEICKGHFVVIEISPEKYNDLYEQFINENKNLNTLLAWGHAKAIEEILKKVNCDIVISDQFADESYIISKLQERGKKIKLMQRHKAEQNLAVAAASILARARFLEKLSKLSDKYKIDLPKGASQRVVETAKTFVDMYGKESLRKVAKLHFKTTKEVINSSPE